jgi:hypothetical protein
VTWRLAPIALAALLPLIQQRIDARLSGLRSGSEVLYLWSGEHVRRLSPGFEDVLADIYWLRTVQYFGGQRAFATEKRFDLLQPLIEITTTLDPRFELAYRYGAVFLAEPQPNGAGQPRTAVQLLERGARANPTSWRIRQDLGFFHYFFLDEPQEAARILVEASRLPGAPVWLRTSAADFLQKGGERATARRVWQHLYEETEGRMRENALFNLRRLDALDVADLHQQAVEEFRRRHGRLPGSLTEPAMRALLRGPLQDPLGVPFEYDRETGTVSIARRSFLWRPAR